MVGGGGGGGGGGTEGCARAALEGFRRGCAGIKGTVG
jgi:hypothetical protein